MEKIWLKNYPPEVSDEINLSHHSLADFIGDHCQRYAEHPAFENFGTTISFSEFDQLSLQFATYLQQTLGLKKGDRFAIMMPNVMQYPVVLYGALRAGLIVVNINPLYTVTEFTHQLNDSGAKALIVMENFAKTVADSLPLASLKHIIVTTMGDCLSYLKKHLIHAYLEWIKKAIPDYHIDNAIEYSAIFETSGQEFRPVLIDQQDTAFLQYTGGTTGVAKGTVLSHGNMLANVTQCLQWLKPRF